MAQSELKHIAEFRTRLKVYELIRNGVNLIDEFREEVLSDSNLAREWYVLVASIEDVANGKMLPITRFRKLKLAKSVKPALFEVKSKNLRLYLTFDYPHGQILIMGGKKVNQSRDIMKVTRLQREFHQYRKG